MPGCGVIVALKRAELYLTGSSSACAGKDGAFQAPGWKVPPYRTGDASGIPKFGI